ncbi:MAG: FAD-dependent oxidoreductase [Actinomycetia bacterium]|nr:FAD-dependent oxidoreductase [Actinomycetes bacterium]
MTDFAHLAAVAKPAVFWSDRPDAPEPLDPLVGQASADLCIVGGGFTGLWTAVQALEAEPGRSVVLLEAEVCGFGASSRNGGFCDASLTHGFLNGLNHWPDDMAVLERLGADNLEAILATIERHNIDADAFCADEVSMAVADWQVTDLAEAADTYARHGVAHTLLDQSGARAVANSATYLGGLASHGAVALVDPARLAWGLKRVARELGTKIHDQSRVTSIDEQGSRLCVSTERGSVVADRVVVATNAWAEPVRQMRRYVVPVYDHVLMTEPLSSQQLAAIGWEGREGLNDSGNQFHYYRRTEDDRILWGGYDANYFFGNGMGSSYEQQLPSYELLARHFFETFPQLEGLGFTHRWAGPIGTTSKFAAAFGTRHRGRLAWAAGYTGLGVGASRFGARVALDLVDGLENERTALKMVRRKPMPFPPEPLRSLAIQTTRRAITKADRTGKQGILLRTLDRFGVGFDS